MVYKMKRTYKLDGLDCAHCAEKIERKIAAIKGVSDASLNFMSQKLVLEYDDGIADIDSQVEKAVKKHEPHVKVSIAG